MNNFVGMEELKSEKNFPQDLLGKLQREVLIELIVPSLANLTRW